MLLAGTFAVQRSHREDLECSLYVLDRLLCILPELFERRWQCNALTHIFKKILHPGNTVRLRREAMRWGHLLFLSGHHVAAYWFWCKFTHDDVNLCHISQLHICLQVVHSVVHDRRGGKDPRDGPHVCLPCPRVPYPPSCCHATRFGLWGNHLRGALTSHPTFQHWEDPRWSYFVLPQVAHGFYGLAGQ